MLIRLTKILSEFNILSKPYGFGTDMLTGRRPYADLWILLWGLQYDFQLFLKDYQYDQKPQVP